MTQVHSLTREGKGAIELIITNTNKNKIQAQLLHCVCDRQHKTYGESRHLLAESRLVGCQAPSRKLTAASRQSPYSCSLVRGRVVRRRSSNLLVCVGFL